MSLILEHFRKMELFTQSLCLLIVSTLSLCGVTEYYVKPSEPTNTSCPAQPCLTLNEYASHSEHYFTSSNIEFRFLPGTHLLNISISVRNVHNVSFTSLETEKSPQIVFYKWSQCKNVPCDQLDAVLCTPFGFWNATSVTITRLSVLVYPQSKPVYCLQILGITFTKVSQLYLYHCNITVVNKTENTDISFGFCNSVYFSDSQFVTVAFSTIVCYQGSLSLMKCKNIEIANSMIVGIVEVYKSVLVIIRDCNVSLHMKGGIYLSSQGETIRTNIYITKSKNISVSGVFMTSHRGGIYIQNTDNTSIANTVFNCSGTGLDLLYNSDTQVMNATILFTSVGISILYSNNIELQHVDLWHNKNGISLLYVVKVNIINVFALGSINEVFSAYDSRSLTIKNLTAVNSTNSFYFLLTTDATIQNLTIKPGREKRFQMQYSEGLIRLSNITIENALFSGSTSSLTTMDITRQTAVLEIIDSQVEMANCSFQNNNITPLKLIQSHLTVYGNLIFINNTAYRGGAMIVINSSMALSENSRTIFFGNRAIDTGGAMYIVANTFHAPLRLDPSAYTICTNCFLSLYDSSNSVKQLIFTNNSAGQGGDVVYGGRMESTCPIDAYNILDYSSCLSRFLEVSVINPKTLSPISSEPSRVCYCNKSGIPDCWTLYHPTVFSVYPGQKISISVVVVGQNFGTVAGSVYAQFLYNKLTPQLDVRESSQEVQHIQCNQLVYTIFSPIEDYCTVLILTAVKISITETNQIVTKEYTNEYKSEYEDGGIDDILDTPVYVKVNLIPCPPGFLLSFFKKCDCNNQLHSLPDVACNIQYSTLQRRGLVWIGPLTDDNDTITDVVSSENCSCQ